MSCYGWFDVNVNVVCVAMVITNWMGMYECGVTGYCVALV